MTREQIREHRRAMWLAPFDQVWPSAPDPRDESSNQAKPREYTPTNPPERTDR